MHEALAAALLLVEALGLVAVCPGTVFAGTVSAGTVSAETVFAETDCPQPPPLPVPAGFESRVAFREPSSPYALSGFAPGLGDRLVVAVRNEVKHVDGLGNTQPLHALPGGQSVGLIARPRVSFALFFTSLQTNTLYQHDLLSQAQRTGPCVRNAFDLDLAPTAEIVVSANPLFPSLSAAAGIWRVDPIAGQHREIVRLSGHSGPLSFDAAGNLLCAVIPTVVPPPRGSVRILRFERAKVQAALGGGPRLAEQDGTAVLQGLDGCYDLDFDDRGRLCISDPNHGGVLRTLPHSYVLDPVPLVPRGAPATLGVGFAELGQGTFDAYQPEDAASLLVLATDWQTSGEVWRITPVRASLVSSPGLIAPPGPVALHISGAPPLAALAIALTMLPPRSEQKLVELSGIPMWWSFPSEAPVLWLHSVTGGDGRARVDLMHPGGFGAAIWFQAACVTFPNPALGSGTTNVHPLTLRP